MVPTNPFSLASINARKSVNSSQSVSHNTSKGSSSACHLALADSYWFIPVIQSITDIPLEFQPRTRGSVKIGPSEHHPEMTQGYPTALKVDLCE